MLALALPLGLLRPPLAWGAYTALGTPALALGVRAFPLGALGTPASAFGVLASSVVKDICIAIACPLCVTVFANSQKQTHALVVRLYPIRLALPLLTSSLYRVWVVWVV